MCKCFTLIAWQWSPISFGETELVVHHCYLRSDWQAVTVDGSSCVTTETLVACLMYRLISLEVPLLYRKWRQQQQQQQQQQHHHHHHHHQQQQQQQQQRTRSNSSSISSNSSNNNQKNIISCRFWRSQYIHIMHNYGVLTIGDIHCMHCMWCLRIWIFSSNIWQVWIVDYNYNYGIYFCLTWLFLCALSNSSLQCIPYCYEALYLPSMKLL